MSQEATQEGANEEAAPTIPMVLETGGADADTFLSTVSSLLEHPPAGAEILQPSGRDAMSDSSHSYPRYFYHDTGSEGPDVDQHIKLRVGNSVFHTTIGTLQKSNFFVRYFDFNQARRAEDDGAYFVDAAGDMFEHVLAFLRDRAAPLFWKHEAGFDYAAYGALRIQAVHFQVWDLVTWIDDKMYLRVIQQDIEIVHFISNTIPIREGLREGVRARPTTVSSKIVFLEQVAELPAVEAVRDHTPFRCPLNRRDHRSQSNCGARCRRGADKAGQQKAYMIHVEMQNIVADLDALVVPEHRELLERVRPSGHTDASVVSEQETESSRQIRTFMYSDALMVPEHGESLEREERFIQSNTLIVPEQERLSGTRSPFMHPDRKRQRLD